MTPTTDERVGQVPDLRDVGKKFMFIGVGTTGQPVSAAGTIVRIQTATVPTKRRDKVVKYIEFTRPGRNGVFRIDVRGNDWSKGAKITASDVDDPKLQDAIDNAIDHIGINQAVIKPEARTDFIITRDAKGDYHVYNEDAWEESEGGLLPWSPPSGEVVGRVNHKTGAYSPIAPGKGPVIKNLPAKPAEVEPVGKALPSDRANFAQNIAHEFAEDLYGNGYGYSSVDHSWSKKVGEYRFVITFDRDKNHPERKYRMDIIQPDGERSVGFYGRDADGFRADIPRFENEAEKMSKRVFGYDPSAPSPRKKITRRPTSASGNAVKTLQKAKKANVTIAHDTDGSPTNFQVRIGFKSEKERKAFLDAIPKSLGIRELSAWQIDGTNEPNAAIDIRLRADGTTGDTNERGIKRALQMIELLKESGVDIEYGKISNGMKIEDFIKAVT